MTQLFISHSSKNNAEALALSQWLTAEGWDAPFLDFEAQFGIAVGDDWKEQLRKALGRCKGFLALVSPDWLRSDWCQREFTVARHLGEAKIFALLLHDAKKSELPEGFSSQWQVISLSSGADLTELKVDLPKEVASQFVSFSRSALQNLAIGLKRWGLNPELFPWPPADEPNRSPYRGLAPLEAQDAGIFYGREAPIIDLLAQLRGLREAAPPRFMAILGASGAGKSSFLRAGILPRLARDDRHFLPLPVIRPERAVLTGSNGLVECLWTLRRERKLNWSRRQIEDAVVAGAPALQPLLQELAQHCQVPDLDGANSQPPSLVLAIDQAEELFQAEGAEQADRFLSLLAELLQADTPKLIVLCTIRSDSYEPLQSAPALVDITQRVFSLPPMPHGAFRQVIEAPVALLKHGQRPLRIEPQLTEALLRDIAEGGAKDALPLLAFTLERLYLHYSADGQLLLREYEDLGRIAGAIETAVDWALQAAQKNPKLPQDRDQCLKLLRRGLIPWMAGIDPRTNLPYRKVARLAQVPEEARALIEHFVEHRLLAKDTNEQGEITVEPAHEALLRQWTKLRGWLEEDTAALATLESVKAASRDWEANSKDPQWLIHAAGRLEDAEALNQRADLAANFEDSDRSYLAECRKLDDERRDRELRQARELAEAQQQRAEQQQRVFQRTRMGLAVASGLLILAVITAFLAWQAQRQAGRETARAEKGLRQAAERAVGRAREQIQSGERSALLAYLAESTGYFKGAAANDIALALQQHVRTKPHQKLNHEMEVVNAIFSPDGSRVVTASFDKTAKIWDADSGAALGSPIRHAKEIRSAVFSPDGTKIVTASQDTTAQIWDANSGEALGETLRHESPVNSASFSPDGMRVVTASDDNTAKVWDAKSGAALGAPLQHEKEVVSAEFSPDGTRIVTASFDSTARIWDVTTGQAIGKQLRHDSRVYSASFSPDGMRVVTASGDDTARIWDATSGAIMGAPLTHENDVMFAAFSPDGARVVTASLDATARVWDGHTGAAQGSPLRHESEVWFANFSSDSTRVVTASFDHTSRIWSASSGVAVGEALHHESRVYSANFSPDGTRVVTASYDNTARIWELNAGAVLGAPLKHAAAQVYSAAFSADGKRVVTASFDNTAQIWDAKSGAALIPPLQHDQAVYSAAFSPDGKHVVTASFDFSAQVWDSIRGLRVGAKLWHEDTLWSAKFSPDGKQVVTASADHTARIWDTLSGASLGAPLGHDDTVWSAAFSPDGTHVVTASFDHTAQIWNTKSGKALGGRLQHDDTVISAEFSADGTRVVTASFDYTAQIWDSTTGAAVGSRLKHNNKVISASFSPDGRWVVTASFDNTVRIWDAVSGSAEGRGLVIERPVSASFSPDGKWILAFGANKAVQMWDAQTGATLGVTLRHPAPVHAAAFSPDGARLVTASFDGFARIWDVQNAELLGSAVAQADLIALSGRRVADNGQLEWLPGPEWMALIKRVKAQAEKGTTQKDQLMRWHFADPSTRTISPFSQITVPQHIEREIDWVLGHPQIEKPDGPNYSPKILDDAYNLDPGHPLILLALSVFEERPETKALWKRLSFPRFDKDPRLAARAAEILLMDKDPENARKAAEIALALPSATEEDKAKANAVLTKLNTPNTSDAL